jgi:hypothetical protein
MATIKQIEAARRNGAKSFGPKTDEGKLRSSQNSVRHGLSGRIVVLQNESEEKFQELLQSLCDHYQPATTVERELVKEIAVARWRLRRIWAMETAMFDLEMDRQRKEVEESFSRIDEPTRLALAFTELSDNSRALSNLHRYEARLRRLSERATADLMRIQAERKAAEKVQNEPEQNESRAVVVVNVQNEPDNRPPTHHADTAASPVPDSNVRNCA